MDMGAEVLEVGVEPRPTGGRRIVAYVVVAVLVILAGCGWAVDQKARAHEFDGVLECVASGQKAISDAGSDISFIENYISPGVNSAPNDQTRIRLYDLVAKAASRGLAALRQARAQCVKLSLPPWHSSLRSARASYLSYLSARLTGIEAIAKDGTQVLQDEPPAVAVLRARARAGLLAAAVGDQQSRRARAAIIG